MTYRTTKVALYGGSFNPFTKGHESVVRALVEQRDVDEIWVMPCYGHTFSKTLLSSVDRIKMIALGLSDLVVLHPNKILISSYEIENELSGSTYETLQLLHGEYPSHQFSIVIGQDNVSTIDKWVDSDKLLTQYNFIVVPRKGYEGTNNSIGNFKSLENINATGISSTMVRNAVDENDKETLKACLHTDVLRFIVAKGLYQKELINQ